MRAALLLFGLSGAAGAHFDHDTVCLSWATRPGWENYTNTRPDSGAGWADEPAHCLYGQVCTMLEIWDQSLKNLGYDEDDFEDTFDDFLEAAGLEEPPS